MSLIVLYFLHSTSVLSFYIDIVLTLSIWSWMDDSHLFRSTWIGHPVPEITLFQSPTLKLQGQGHGCGQRAMSYSWPSTLLILFLFISHQSDQQFLRYSYFEIWPWNIQGQGHKWGRRWRSHIIPSIQPMHFLFISHQSDHWDMAKIVLDLEKTHPKLFNGNLPK